MIVFLRAILERTFLGLLVDQVMRRPIIVGVLSLVMAAFWTNLAIGSYGEAQRLPREPMRLTTAEAAALAPIGYENRPWVNLTDVMIDCHNIHPEKVGSSYRTSVVMTDPLETIIIIATYSGVNPLSCADIAGKSASGELSHMNERRYARFLELAEFDLSGYENATAYMDMCVFCGGRNASTGVILGVTMALVSLSLYPLLVWNRRKQAPL